MEPVIVSFEFRGNLTDEVEKVTLSVQGLRDESAKTYQRLIADSSSMYNSLSADNKKLASSVQENINALRELSVIQKALEDDYRDNKITTDQYTQAKIALTIQENNLRNAISTGMNTLNERINTEKMAVDSITQLSSKVRELTDAYYNMSKADREGIAGEGVLKQIGDLDKQITTAQSRLSGYSRIAGTGFNSLNMSVQQVARELPSLTMGANMFFLAISNNLPILADNIKAARIEYDLMKKSGQSAVPVWKQVLSSIVSWQTALVVGITLLSVYGKDIGNWVKKIFSAKNALDESIASLDTFQKKVAEGVSKSVADFKYMASEWAALGDDMAAKKKYLLENADAIKKIGVAISDMSDAEKIFTSGKEAFIKSLYERAKAAAAMELAADKYKDAVKKMMESEAASKDVTLADKMSSTAAMSSYVSSQGASLVNLEDITPEAFRDMRLERLEKEKQKYFDEADKFLQEAVKFSVEEEKILSDAELKTTESLVENSVGAIKKAIELKEKSLDNLTDKKDYDRVKQEIQEENKKLEAITGKSENELGKEKNATEKANVIKAETAMRELEIQRRQETLKQKEKDAELELRQQNIDLMKDSADKELAQIALNYDKKIAEIDKKGREYIFEQQKIEQAQWENDHPNWKKKGLVFNPTTRNISQLPGSQSGELSNGLISATNIREKEESDLLKNTLKHYQDYVTKRLEIERKYNDDVAYLVSQRNENNKDAINSAINEVLKAKKKDLSGVSLGELKDTDMWNKIFGDLDKMALPSLEELLQKAKEVNTSAWNPENVKEYQDAILRLENTIRSRSPFKSIGEDWKTLLKNIREGNKDGIAGSLSNIDQAVQKINEDLKTIAGGIGDIFGDEAGYAAGQVMELTSALGGFVTGASKLASGDIIGGIASVVSSIGSIFSMGKKVKEMNRAAREEVQKYYDTAIEGEKEYQLLLRQRQRTQQEIGESALSYNQRITTELTKQQQANNDEYQRLFSQIQGDSYVSDVAYKHGTWFRKAQTWNEYSSLAGKSYEDIEKLYTEGKLEEKTAKLFEQLRNLKEEGVDIDQMLDDQNEAMREAFTGTTTNSIADSIIQGFAQGKRSASDFADDFQEMLNNAVLQGIKMQALEEPLRKWYEDFAAASESGLTESSIADLKAKYDKIISDTAKRLDDAEKITGIDLSDTKREASQKGIASMSQDSANELNGNFNTMLIYLDKTNTAVTNINTLLIQGLDILNRIAANTDRLENIENDIRVMRHSFQYVVDNGLKLRK